MSSTDQLLDVKILDRTYHVKCPAEEAAKLQESARYLDEKMRKIAGPGATSSTERLAVITALNICHEFLNLKQEKCDANEAVNKKVKDMQQRIQKFLGLKEGAMV